MYKHFPFSAIVGQENMKKALILNAIYPSIGGVLIKGERGTAKSTAVRALAKVLPNNAPFVELPVGATEDRVIGTLDVEKILKTGEKKFEPGLLAKANGGVLYVDEVNLLDDYIVDVLLDSAASGSCVVEREGISYIYDARFILIGTMNPEEGDLRPQLLDRFALSVEIESIHNSQDRIRILERNIEFENSPEKFLDKWIPEDQKLTEKIINARERIDEIHFTRNDLMAISTAMAKTGIDGHRADLVILKAAIANAAFSGRDRINEEDVLTATSLALPHRLKQTPLGEPELSEEAFNELLKVMALQVKGQDVTANVEYMTLGDEKKN